MKIRMMGLKKFVFCGLAFLVGSLGLVNLRAAPCNNGQIRSREEAFESSSAIFVGRVIQLKEAKLKGLNYTEVTLDVNPEKLPIGKFFKGGAYLGKLEKSITVVMPIEGENVQPLRIGKPYLIHAIEDPTLEKLYTDLCWRNSLVGEEMINSDLEWLEGQFENQQAIDSRPSLPEVIQPESD